MPTKARKLPDPLAQRIIDAELFDLEDSDFIKVAVPDVYTVILGIFSMVGMKPIAYQLGHKFFDTNRKAYYVARKRSTLEMSQHLLNKRIFWMPTIDEMLAHAYNNDMTISLFISHTKARPKHYRVLVHDVLFPEKDNKELARYTSYEPWFSTAHALAYAYRRRMETYGLESINVPIYTYDEKFAGSPAHLTDHAQWEETHPKRK